MSTLVASRHNNNIGGAGTGHQATSTTTTTTMAAKQIKTEDKSRKDSPSTRTASKTSSASPKQAVAKIEPDTKPATSNAAETATSTTTTAAPLAPPPRPVQNENNPDYFAPSHKNHLSSEPNPFEQSFGNPATETPGKGINLPPVTSLTSPAPLGTGGASLTGGFGWSNSLRSGPLSPAMLSGPTGDYFDNIRSFPTPNESSLRTGLTPGGGGSMFPAPSPGTQALFGFGGTTPATLDFVRSAQSAATQSKAEPTTTITSNIPAQTATMNANMAQHPDNEAANGLFMLAQASAPQVNGTYSNGVARPARNNGSISATSNPTQDDQSDDNKNGTRKSKRASAGKNNRRKTEDAPPKQPAAKKSKSNAGMAMDRSPEEDDLDSDDDMDMDSSMPKDTKKMTDEEKRKNFLERNRVAALKCRQRKKQWLQNLQNKVEIYSSENDALNAQVTALRDEVLNLKTILIAHKDCPIAQQQSQTGAYLQHGVDYGNAHYGNAPYGMSMQQQAVMQGARRSS